MRRARIAIIAAAGLAATTLLPVMATAAPDSVAPNSGQGAFVLAQYYGAGPQGGGDDWERRREWREWRQQRDEARINEAARREAMMIEQEREQRRAWRRAQREQQYDGNGAAYGYGRGAGSREMPLGSQFGLQP